MVNWREIFKRERNSTRRTKQKPVILGERGKIFINKKCIYCALCADIAPQFFGLNNHVHFAFILRQPQSEEDMVLVRDVIKACPVNAIRIRKNR